MSWKLNPRSGSFLRKIHVATISDSDIERVKAAARTVSIDNENVEWDCQDYVLEVLDQLQDDFVLEEDDEDYSHQLYIANSMHYGWISVHSLFLCLMAMFYCVWSPHGMPRKQTSTL
ncbi:hypothetical protein BDV19DRAFT_393440 [Aspergillus venezuelensis]